MSRLLFCIAMAVLLAPVAAHAQRLAPNDTRRLIGDQPMVGAVPGACMTNYADLRGGTAYSVDGRTAIVPVTFTRIDKNDDGKYQLGAALDIGVGYTWFSGSGTYLAPSEEIVVAPPQAGILDVEPQFFAGLALSPGVRNDAGEIGGALSATGFVGFKSVAVSVGYDFLAASPVFGLSTKIDPFRFRRGSGARLCVRPGY